MGISFITTVFNEEESINIFLDSLLLQSRKLDEVVIVDGGSTDNTVGRIKVYESRFKAKKIGFKILIKKGNRSVGRNEAIKHASENIIACSDAGNVLDKDWIKNIAKPFENKNVAVVAGYYKGLPKDIFQKCLIPYAFVMPDKVDPDTFLPATRSVAFRKSVWEKVGGFNEKLSHNEDYSFAKALQKAKVSIIFKEDAIVYWLPRTNLQESFIMFFRFAYGDAEARIWRPKVIFLFARYFAAVLLVVLTIMKMSSTLFGLLICFGIMYLIWAIAKNYRYVKDWRAFYLLPLLQITADSAVLAGTVNGLLLLM